MVAYMARIKIPIADIRPTQLTLGLSEVTRRAAKIAKLSPEDREAYFERKAIPHVIGPGKRIYIVNHHHLARALWSLDVREAVLGDQLADWSDFEIGPFWRMMESSLPIRLTHIPTTYRWQRGKISGNQILMEL
jgi:hypothetical protein